MFESETFLHHFEYQNGSVSVNEFVLIRIIFISKASGHLIMKRVEIVSNFSKTRSISVSADLLEHFFQLFSSIQIFNPIKIISRVPRFPINCNFFKQTTWNSLT